MIIEYEKRFVEVDEVLNHLSRADYNRIPMDLKKLIKEQKDQNYNWEYDENKTLENQSLHSDTIAILSYICAEYLLSEKQKLFVNQIHSMNNK